MISVAFRFQWPIGSLQASLHPQNTRMGLAARSAEVDVWGGDDARVEVEAVRLRPQSRRARVIMGLGFAVAGCIIPVVYYLSGKEYAPPVAMLPIAWGVGGISEVARAFGWNKTAGAMVLVASVAGAVVLYNEFFPFISILWLVGGVVSGAYLALFARPVAQP